MNEVTIPKKILNLLEWQVHHQRFIFGYLLQDLEACKDMADGGHISYEDAINGALKSIYKYHLEFNARRLVAVESSTQDILFDTKQDIFGDKMNAIIERARNGEQIGTGMESVSYALKKLEELGYESK